MPLHPATGATPSVSRARGLAPGRDKGIQKAQSVSKAEQRQLVQIQLWFCED